MPFLRFTAETHGLPVPHLTVKVRSKFDICIENSNAFARGENGPRSRGQFDGFAMPIASPGSPIL